MPSLSCWDKSHVLVFHPPFPFDRDRLVDYGDRYIRIVSPGWLVLNVGRIDSTSLLFTVVHIHDSR